MGEYATAMGGTGIVPMRLYPPGFPVVAGNVTPGMEPGTPSSVAVAAITGQFKDFG